VILIFTSLRSDCLLPSTIPPLHIYFLHSQYQHLYPDSTLVRLCRLLTLEAHNVGDQACVLLFPHDSVGCLRRKPDPSSRLHDYPYRNLRSSFELRVRIVLPFTPEYLGDIIHPALTALQAGPYHYLPVDTPLDLKGCHGFSS
jgi:hypothetical protein